MYENKQISSTIVMTLDPECYHFILAPDPGRMICSFTFLYQHLYEIALQKYNDP